MLPSASPSSLLSFDDVVCHDAAQFASRRSWSPSYQTMRAALSETPRHVLVLNFDPDTDPLEVGALPPVRTAVPFPLTTTRRDKSRVTFCSDGSERQGTERVARERERERA
mmetsp:Transcript_10204/g.20929  ORF Transcript_10204/g.20929 Transcript_10204/m.20929 type:complete len:111 (-) Transcript_10204:730-1062(-)